MGKLTSYFANVKEEIQKVIFPTKVQIRQAFIAVFLVVIIITAFLSLVDLVMVNLVEFLVS
ncbi:MAG: preprotein translocase subunit SecE [Sulfurovum sp. AS07-7]|jgi:preprotein translocase subunit SecE|nr:MAG: preprotein translocase subunit SecE [Sulfurovum sp. AS07-7]TQV63119.1 MAG: preprotein translocase subunit SecE [Sulfurovum sp.]